jgi:hypothetical protein
MMRGDNKSTPVTACPIATMSKIISAEKAVEANATLHRGKETSKVLLHCRN